MTKVHVLTHKRLPRNNGKCSHNWRSQFFSKWDLSCEWVFWGCDFQVILRSPNSVVLAEVYVWTRERLHGNNDKCLRNSRKWLFLKMKFIMQLRFLRLWFSSVLVFSVLYYCDKSPCFNTRAVAQNQWQMLEKLEKLGFSQNEIMSFRRFCFSGVPVFSETHDVNRSLCFSLQAAA